MAERRREVGFTRAIGRMSVSSVLWPEGAGALVFGGGGGLLLTFLADLSARREVAQDGLVVLAPLLGVVLTALTIVIAMSSEEYIKALAQTSYGVVGFYRPFVVAIGFEIWTILALIGYRSIAEELPAIAEGCAFVFSMTLVVFSLLDILAIARNVLMHAVTRATSLEEKPSSEV